MCLHKNLALSSVVPVLIMIWVSTMCERMVAFSTRQKSTTLKAYKSLDAALRKYFCHSLLICAAWRTISGEAKLLFHTNNSKTSNKTTQMHLGPKKSGFIFSPNFTPTTAKAVTKEHKWRYGLKITGLFQRHNSLNLLRWCGSLTEPLISPPASFWTFRLHFFWRNL